MPKGNMIIPNASGSLGCGAFEQEMLDSVQLHGPPSWQSVNIASKELLPIVVSAALWGSHWNRKQVWFISDNQAIVNGLIIQVCPQHISHASLLV